MVTVDRGRYGCLREDGTLVVAMRARELGRRAVAVGDVVFVVGDMSGADGALARIVRIEDRVSVLRRTADDDDPIERVVVANADRLVIMCAAADPAPQPRLVDRCLVAAYDAGVEPLLCITKVDIGSPDDLVETYRHVGLPIVTSSPAVRSAVADELMSHMRGHVTVVVGSSGVGKSTMVNAIVPDATQRVAETSAATGKGMHTTSAAIAIPLVDRDGWVVDTPGVRSFGLAHVEPSGLVRCFPDLVGGTAECPTDCDHLDVEVCALDAWVAAGHADARRLDSLRRLLVSPRQS